MKKILLIIILLQSLIIVKGQELFGDKDESWSSNKHKLEIYYSAPWEIVSAADESDKVFIGLMCENAKMGYSVEINLNPRMDSLTNNEYYDYTKNYLLSQDKNNKLISDGHILFQGKNFYQQIFVFHNKKWGLQKMHEIVKRKKGYIIAINFFYSVEKNNINENAIPLEIVEINEELRIFD